MKNNLKKVISAIAVLALSTSSFVALAAEDENAAEATAAPEAVETVEATDAAEAPEAPVAAVYTGKGFADVPATADYAKAVDQLTAMDIVEGYDDGTFKPNESVTRAQMTAMIIRALGSDNAAKSMSGRDTAFSDVTQNHWAAGYVAVANTTNPQFINGMGDGTFAPDATVTYAQALTMLVRAVGYETLAAQQGYPNGYLSQAAILGISKGVVVSNDTELNRGQVAILIDNAIVDAPILGEGEWQTNYLNGTGGYSPEAKDGTNPYARDFWTTLATKQKIYKTYGMVAETRASGKALDADEVKFRVMRAENFDGMSYGFGNYNQGSSVTVKANVGNTDAALNLNQYAEVLIKEVSDDEFVILSYTPTGGRTDSVKFATSQYVEESYSADNHVISFYDTNGSNSRNYRLCYNSDDNPLEWYVNDYPMDKMDVKTYLQDNYVGEVELLDYVDADGNYGSDGRYDAVMITYYQDAVVDEVSVSTSGVATIQFLDYDTNLKGGASLKIDPDDDQRIVTFKGDATSYEELEQYDVLSIQYDPTARNLADSESVVVTVSRNQVTGTVSRVGTDDLTDCNLYYINSDAYVYNRGLFNDRSKVKEEQALQSSVEYTIYLDAFGYIAYREEGVNSKNYGIIDRMYTAEGATSYKIRLIEADGSVNVYEYYKQNAGEFTQAALDYAYDDFDVNSSNGTDGRKAVQDRVVTYTITGAGQLRITGSAAPTGGTQTAYSLNSNRVGTVRMNDNTNVLDLIDYEKDGSVSVMGSFQDGSDYVAYGYGKSNTDSTFSFVIVTYGIAGIGMDSPFAVVISKSSADYGDGDTTMLTVYTNGAEEDLMLDVDNADTDTINVIENMVDVGDAFIYELGVENRITDARMVYDINAKGTSVASYGEYVNRVFADAMTYEPGEYGTSFDGEVYDDTRYGVPTATTYNRKDEKTEKYLYPNFNRGTRGDYAYFTFGPVISNNNGVTLGTLEKKGNDWVSYIDKGVDYSYDSKYYVYNYNWGERLSADKLEIGAKSLARTSMPSNLSNLGYSDGDGSYLNWTALYGVENYDEDGNAVVNADASYNQASISFALLKIYGDDIAVGYSIIPPAR